YTRHEHGPFRHDAAIPLRAFQEAGDLAGAPRDLPEQHDGVDARQHSVEVAPAIARPGATFADLAQHRTRVADDFFGGRGRVLHWWDPYCIGLRGFVHVTSLSRMAARTRSGVAGRCVTRTPVACRTAFKMAGAVGISAGSPTPFAPYGPSGSASSTRCVTTGGMSPTVGIR